MKIRRMSWAAGLAACLALLCVACQSNPPLRGGAGLATAGGDATVMAGALPLCTACGQIEYSAKCCQPGQPLCAKCGLAKGSPGCCRIEKDSVTRVALCTACGQFKGSPECCASGQVLCTKCKLVKGSPGCCKIESGTR